MRTWPALGIAAIRPYSWAPGDIAMCNAPEGAEATARLLDNIRGTVFAAGDNAYMSGTEAEYHDCYGRTWGRHLARTRPVPDNHEYQSIGAAPYFGHFGDGAGVPGLGYYSFTLGSWFVVALNSEVDMGAASARVQWLRGELERNPARCALAYWHRPLYSSGNCH